MEGLEKRFGDGWFFLLMLGIEGIVVVFDYDILVYLVVWTEHR